MRIPVRPEEVDRCQVVLSGALPASPVLISSKVWPKDPYGEGLYIFGPAGQLEQLRRLLRALLNKGDNRYYWDAVRAGKPNELFLHLEETGHGHIPRWELVETLFRRDAIVYANISFSSVATLSVISPWGNIIGRQYIGLPGEENGTIVVGGLA